MSKIEVDAIVPQSGTTLTVGEAGDTVDISNATLSANLNANNLTSGTIPDARFPATLPAVDGSNLTNIQIAGGYTACDAITVTNTATFALTAGGSAVSPASASNCIVSLNGIIQAPGDSYTISGSNITFASALAAGSDVIDFITVLGTALNVGTVSDGTIGLNKLSASGTKDATTFLRGDNTFATPSSGLVKLFSSTPTNVSTIDINGYFTSDYDAYVIYAQNYFGVSGGGYLRIRGMVSGSAITSSDYYTSAKGKYSQSGTSGDINEAGWGADNMRLEGNKGSSYTYSGSSTITIYNPLSTSMAKVMTQFSSGFRSSSQYESVIGGGTLNTTSALSGVQLAWNSGNVTMSKLAMYGVKV